MFERLDLVAERYAQLQAEGCGLIEQCDGKEFFTKDRWSKEIGSGITRVLSDGGKIAKGALNFSRVTGDLNEGMSAALGVKAEKYGATGISSIFHGKNPFVPTIHMNVRYFAFDNGLEWFGGGIDLTPVYIDTRQAAAFHLRLKQVCDKYHPDFYPEFKSWADNYFFLKHRDETRGVGGIFFDRQQPGTDLDFDRWMDFTTELARLYPVLYSELVNSNADNPYSEKESEWQKIRWGRYAEFNLVYDRGTKFGLESGGNAESILISLPPDVKWKYQFTPDKGSREEQTQKFLRKGINWIEMG